MEALETRSTTGSGIDPEEVRGLERSLYKFSKAAWHLVEPQGVFTDGWHIGCIAEHLQAVTDLQINNLVINIPPRHMKSLLVGVFWFCWAWASEPWTKWLYSSYSDGIACRDADKSRQIISSPWYQARWGERTRIGRKDTSGWFDSTASGYRISTTVRGRALGQGGDYIIADDPMKALDARSAVERMRIIEWWTKTMSTRINDPKRTRKVVVMQRLHENDLSGYLAAREHGYEVLVLPAEYEPQRVYSLPAPKPRPRDSIVMTKVQMERPETRDPRTTAGELLWPDRFGPKELAELKIELEADGVAGQLQQRPSPADGTIFQRGHFRYCRVAHTSLGATFILTTADGKELKKVPVLRCRFFQCIDTATKTNEHNDFTAVGTFAVTPDGELIIYHVAAYKIELPYQLAYMKAARRGAAVWHRELKQIIPGPRWPRPLVGQWVEDAASGSGLLQAGMAEGVVFRTLRPDRDKVQRAAPLSALYEAGRVYHHRAAEGGWLVGYEDEAVVFPLGAHDDRVDTAAYAAHVALYDAILRAGMAGLEDVAAGYKASTDPEADPGAIRRPWAVEPGETTEEVPDAEIVVTLDALPGALAAELLRSPDVGERSGPLAREEYRDEFHVPAPDEEWHEVLDIS